MPPRRLSPRGLFFLRLSPTRIPPLTARTRSAPCARRPPAPPVPAPLLAPAAHPCAARTYAPGTDQRGGQTPPPQCRPACGSFLSACTKTPADRTHPLRSLHPPPTPAPPALTHRRRPEGRAAPPAAVSPRREKTTAKKKGSCGAAMPPRFAFCPVIRHFLVAGGANYY